MSEIDKLRTRLINVQSHVTEYRMTVLEAKSLLHEIDELRKLKPTPTVLVEATTVVEQSRVIDGGSF
jgi:hypothetical protein